VERSGGLTPPREGGEGRRWNQEARQSCNTERRRQDYEQGTRTQKAYHQNPSLFEMGSLEISPCKARISRVNESRQAIGREIRIHPPPRGARTSPRVNAVWCISSAICMRYSRQQVGESPYIVGVRKAADPTETNEQPKANRSRERTVPRTTPITQIGAICFSSSSTIRTGHSNSWRQQWLSKKLRRKWQKAFADATGRSIRAAPFSWHWARRRPAKRLPSIFMSTLKPHS